MSPVDVLLIEELQETEFDCIEIQREGRQGLEHDHPRRIAIVPDKRDAMATVPNLDINAPREIWSVHREIADGELVRVLPDYEINDRAALWMCTPSRMTAKVRASIDFLIDRVGRSRAWQLVTGLPRIKRRSECYRY